MTYTDDGEFWFLHRMQEALDLPDYATPDDCINRARKIRAALIMANATSLRRRANLDIWISAATSNAQFGRVNSEVTPRQLSEDIGKAVDTIQKRQAENTELQRQVVELTLDLQNLRAHMTTQPKKELP